MIGLGIAFIVLGIVFLFIVPWVGIPVGLVGLVLAFLWVAGFGRRAVGREARGRAEPRLELAAFAPTDNESGDFVTGPVRCRIDGRRG